MTDCTPNMTLHDIFVTAPKLKPNINTDIKHSDLCGYSPFGDGRSSGPVHLKAGFLPLSSVTCTFLISSRLLRTLAMSYSLRILAKNKHRRQ